MNHSATTMFTCNQNLVKLRALQQLCLNCSHRFNSNLPSTSATPSSEQQNSLARRSAEENNVALRSARNELIKSVTYGRMPGTRRKTQILRMDPAEWSHLPINQQKIPYAQRKGESQSVWKHILPDRQHNRTDRMAFLQADIDLRPVALKRIWRRIEAEHEIKQQAYNPERHKILGSELATSHFILFRKGKVKFLHQPDWIIKYRIDQDTEKEERDLVPLTARNRAELCTLPTSYDPLYRLEAIDANGVTVFYNGWDNFEGLHHLTWLSLRRADKRFNDWCLDRVYNLFHDTLEYLDLSECAGISERGISAAWKLKCLKTLVVENLPHIKNLEMVCALLEEQIPGLTCVGVDYETRAMEIKKENEEADRLEQERLAQLEANTINVTPRSDSDESGKQDTNWRDEVRRIGSKI